MLFNSASVGPIYSRLHDVAEVRGRSRYGSNNDTNNCEETEQQRDHTRYDDSCAKCKGEQGDNIRREVRFFHHIRNLVRST